MPCVSASILDGLDKCLTVRLSPPDGLWRSLEQLSILPIFLQRHQQALLSDQSLVGKKSSSSSSVSKGLASQIPAAMEAVQLIGVASCKPLPHRLNALRSRGLISPDTLTEHVRRRALWPNSAKTV